MRDSVQNKLIPVPPVCGRVSLEDIPSLSICQSSARVRAGFPQPATWMHSAGSARVWAGSPMCSVYVKPKDKVPPVCGRVFLDIVCVVFQPLRSARVRAGFPDTKTDTKVDTPSLQCTGGFSYGITHPFSPK